MLKKIQDLPDSKKKIIIWLTTVFLGLLLLFFWIKKTKEVFKNFPKEELGGKLKELPKIEFPKFELPEFELPEINSEELESIKEEIESLEKENEKTTPQQEGF